MFTRLEYCSGMQSVESILASIYGSEGDAAPRLGVVRSAISNWKAQGYFPARLVAQLLADARAARVKIDFADIPISTSTKTGSAA